MSHSTPRGLPGFLRRSLRHSDMEIDGDYNNDIMVTNTTSSGINISIEDNKNMVSSSQPVNEIGCSDTLISSSVSAQDDNANSGIDEHINYDNDSMNQVDRKFRYMKSPSTDFDEGNNDQNHGIFSHKGAISPSLEKQVLEMNISNKIVNTNEIQFIQSTNQDNGVNHQVPTQLNSKVAVVQDIPIAPSNNNHSETKKTIPGTSKPKKKRIMNYKETEFEKAITEPVVNITLLRKLGWNGIPPQHRPQAWKILLGYLPTNEARRTQTLKRKRLEYQDAIKQHYDISDDTRTNSEQETLRQVLVDVPRTAPDVPLFRNDLVRQSLSRLLYIWACRHPASGYVQGINDLATPLIAVFLSEFYDNQQQQYFKDHDELNETNDEIKTAASSIHEGSVLDGSVMDDLSMEDLKNVEADVYWCLTNLLAGIQDHYTSDQPGVQRMVMRLEDLVTRMDVELTNHLKDVGVEFIQFAFRWMNCLLLREFKLESVVRLWDTYLSEGDGAGFAMGFETFHVYVCAAFLCQFSDILRNMDFDDLFGFMQNVPTSHWSDSDIEILLSQAFVLSTLFHGSEAHLAGVNH